MPDRQYNVFEIKMPTNPMGTAAFIVSLIALLTAGLLSPISLVLSIAGVQRQPRDLAIAGLALSTIGCLTLIVVLCFSASILDYVAQWQLVSAEPTSRPKWTAPAGPEKRGEPYEQPVSHPWASATKCRLGESPLGSPTLYFELKNLSSERIARIKVDVAVTEKGNGSVMAKASLSGSFNKPIEAGSSRPVELRIPLTSDLNAIFPDPKEVVVTITHAEMPGFAN